MKQRPFLPKLMLWEGQTFLKQVKGSIFYFTSKAKYEIPIWSYLLSSMPYQKWCWHCLPAAANAGQAGESPGCAEDSSVPSVGQRDRQRDAQERVKGVALLLAMRARQGGPGQTDNRAQLQLTSLGMYKLPNPTFSTSRFQGKPWKGFVWRKGKWQGRDRDSQHWGAHSSYRKSSRQESSLILQNSILIQNQSAPYNGFVS